MDPITFILLDNSQTTYGVTVLVDGVDISQFERNPVMFWRHNDYDLPVGKWQNARKLDGKLLADAVFDEKDTDEDVQRMISKVEQGFIKMASCGLVDLETQFDPANPDAGYVVTKCRLREASIVAIGANYNALRLYDKEDKLIDLQKEGLKLSDFIVKSKIENEMKINLSKLNLTDGATDEQINQAIEKLANDKDVAETRATNAETELNTLKLADSTKKKTEFEAELTLAFKDGRLNEKPVEGKPTPVRDRMLNLFDKDPEGTLQMVKDLTPHKDARMELSDLGDKESAWAKRQAEIEENSKKK